MSFHDRGENLLVLLEQTTHNHVLNVPIDEISPLILRIVWLMVRRCRPILKGKRSCPIEDNPIRWLAMADALGDTPLVLKIGLFDDAGGRRRSSRPWADMRQRSVRSTVFPRLSRLPAAKRPFSARPGHWRRMRPRSVPGGISHAGLGCPSGSARLAAYRSGRRFYGRRRPVEISSRRSSCSGCHGRHA